MRRTRSTEPEELQERTNEPTEEKAKHSIRSTDGGFHVSQFWLAFQLLFLFIGGRSSDRPEEEEEEKGDGGLSTRIHVRT